MRSRTARSQEMLAFFLILVVLFAPAREEHPGNLVRLPDELVGARILVPTVLEGISATDPKLSARQLPGPDQRSRPGLIPLIPPSIAALLLLLLLLTWLAREETGDVLRRVVLRALVPRAPPSLLVG